MHYPHTRGSTIHRIDSLDALSTYTCINYTQNRLSSCIIHIHVYQQHTEQTLVMHYPHTRVSTIHRIESRAALSTYTCINYTQNRLSCRIIHIHVYQLHTEQTLVTHYPHTRVSTTHRIDSRDLLSTYTCINYTQNRLS